MNCLETEKLIRYAYRLLEEPAASPVRAHLRECSRCREIVEQHTRLDAVLSEWKVAEPSPVFDARVRQAVEARQDERAFWEFSKWRWTHGLALASLGLLIVTGWVWITHGPGRLPSPQVVVSPSPSARGAAAAPQSASLHQLTSPAHSAKGLNPVVPGPQSAGVSRHEDKDAQTLEDYDLAANFDLLSELPKGDQRVVN